MKKQFLLLASTLFLLSLSLFLETKVQAQEYDEVSYDDLINQISKKRSRVSESTNPSILDDITLHAGFGLLTSAMEVNEINRHTQLQLNGFQLSFGIDLFSPNWVAEGAIRNFGTGSAGTQNYSFRELDMKVLYRAPLQSSDLGLRLGAGLATQYLSMTDVGTYIDESAPASILFGGIEGKVNRNFAIGAEIGYRSSLLNSAANRDSLDLTLRLDSFF